MTELCYVKDLNLCALADFTALHAANDHCPIFNCINGASTGFSVLGFALCKTCVTLNFFFNLIFYIALVKSRFLFFFSLSLLLLHFSTIGTVQFKNKHFKRLFKSFIPVRLLNLCPDFQLHQV